jgi:hypothetical protein
MPPHAYISHRTKGRIRIKIPSKKGGEEYFSLVNAHFAGFHRIERLEANPLTASVLFITEADAKEIADHAAEKGLFLLRTSNRHSTTLSRKIMGDFDRLNDGIKKLTGGDIDIPGIVFLGLLGTGIYQVSIGNLTAPAWYTAFWYAMNIFTKSYGGGGESGGP